MPDRRGRQHDEDQATLDGAHPEDIHPQQAKAVGERVDQYRPEQRPQMVTTRRRENAAPIKVARTVSSSNGVAVPLELPEPWLSSGKIASPAAIPPVARP
jgi:hypothetical protein